MRWGPFTFSLPFYTFRNDLVNHRDEKEEREVEVVIQRHWEAA